MFVNRRWRRRRQALLGRGMADDGRASRPSVRDPAPDPLACDRLYGTRSGTRSSRTHATDLTARDPAPAPFARDPAPAPCARDRLYGTRSGTGSFRTRLTLRHAIRHPAPLARDRFYGTRSDTDSFRTRPTLRHEIRHRLFSHATDFTARDPAPAPFARDDHSFHVRMYPDMPGIGALAHFW